MAVRLNPLTIARFVALPDGMKVLRTRSFAPKRSFRGIDLVEADDPDIYARLADWARGGEPFMPSDPLAVARWLGAGLLVTDEEHALLPAVAGPCIEDATPLVRALCPVAADFLGKPLAIRLGDELAEPLAREGHVELPGLLDNDDLAAVRAWYRTLHEDGWCWFEARRQRTVIHNDPVARRVLESFAPVLSRLAGFAVKPSYAFAVEYVDGAELTRHVDRDQCEFTASLFIEHLPDSDGRCPWPIVLHTVEGDVSVKQLPGGGPLFRGGEIPHSRAALTPGERSRMLFLHYVQKDFAGPLD